MTTHDTVTQGATRRDFRATESVLLAGSLTMLIGAFLFLEGLAALIRGRFYVLPTRYAFEIDITTWGWIQLIAGAVAFAVGVLLFTTDSRWLRVLALVVAGLSAVDGFFFVPYYPFWSLLVIALAVFVIWALARERGAIAAS